jgi:hypothetical protein
MATSSLKSALVNTLGDAKLTDASRAHIKRWLAEVDDPVWEQIAADVETYGKLPPLVDGPYSYFIARAVQLRLYVETELDKPSLLKKRERERRQQRFSDAMSLANLMDEVVRRCRKIAPGAPDPSGRPTEWQLSMQWLTREAQKIRHGAQDLLKPDGWDWPFRVNVSRQSGGKGKRRRSRELGVFMQEMVNCIYRACGKPGYHAVATITNIAFPAARVDAEDVRSACRPTTRAGRRRKSGAPSH